MSEFRIIDSVRGVRMDTPFGQFQSAAIRLRDAAGQESEHVCLYRTIRPEAPCLLRLNSACITSELFGCRRCDCGWQLDETLRRFRREESCALVYTRTDEGRGHGIVAKLRSYVESDGSARSALERRYVAMPDLRSFAGQVFAARWLGVRRARLLSDNSAKKAALVEQGVEVEEVIGLRSSDAGLVEFYRFKDRLHAGG